MTNNNSVKIGVATATIVGMNAMIGSGIFTTTAAMATQVGPAGILAYIFVVIAIWFIALSLARLARLFPQEGSFYIYAKQWGGHSVGIIASSAYLVGLLIAMGLLTQLAGEYLKLFFPSYSPYALGIIALGALVVLNMFGVVLSQLGQHILITCTVFPLITTIVMCLTKVNLAYLTPFAPYGLTNVLKATRVVIFGFFGFECAASLFNIVDKPEKNVPRALTYSIILVGTLYILFAGSIILSIPTHYFTDPRMPLTKVLSIIFPHNPWLITLIHSAILSAILGTVHSMIWTSSTLLILFVKQLKSATARSFYASGFLNQKTSVLFVGLCIFISYISLKNIDLFFNLTALFIVSAYILSMITLLTKKEEWQSGHNIKTIIGITTAATILLLAVEGLIQGIINIIH